MFTSAGDYSPYSVWVGRNFAEFRGSDHWSNRAEYSRAWRDRQLCQLFTSVARRQRPRTPIVTRSSLEESQGRRTKRIGERITLARDRNLNNKYRGCVNHDVWPRYTSTRRRSIKDLIADPREIDRGGNEEILSPRIAAYRLRRATDVSLPPRANGSIILRFLGSNLCESHEFCKAPREFLACRLRSPESLIQILMQSRTNRAVKKSQRIQVSFSNQAR